MILVPLERPGNLDLKDNPAKNEYVIAMWFFFTLMLVGLVLICLPFCGLWSIMLIPQRVDSRANYERLEQIDKEIKNSIVVKANKDGNSDVNLNINNNNNVEQAYGSNEIMLPMSDFGQSYQPSGIGGSVNTNTQNNIQGNNTGNNKRKMNLKTLARMKKNDA